MACLVLVAALCLPVPPMGPSLGAYQYTTDEYIFHRVMMRSVGENGFSYEATWLTACTIYNRLERGYGNGSIDGVLEAYYASDMSYSGELSGYVSRRLPMCHQGILYALSYDDIVWLGFPIDADIVSGDEICRSHGDRSERRMCAYFYTQWHSQ